MAGAARAMVNRVDLTPAIGSLRTVALVAEDLATEAEEEEEDSDGTGRTTHKLARMMIGDLAWEPEGEEEGMTVTEKEAVAASAVVEQRASEVVAVAMTVMIGEEEEAEEALHLKGRD